MIKKRPNLPWSVQEPPGEKGWKKACDGGHGRRARQRKRELTWFACGAATNKTGPDWGTRQAPRGTTSRKKESTMLPTV